MKATLHPDAEEDIAEAASFYEREGSPELAARFVAEVKRVINLMLANPGLGTPRSNGRKFFPTRIFPYAVIYRPTGDGIYVLVVRRHRRRPKFGIARKPIRPRTSGAA
jgi:plasmid stabilization system protein ParE